MANDVEPFAQIVVLKGSAISGSFERIQYSVVRCGHEELQPGKTRDYYFAYGTGTERIMRWDLESLVQFDGNQSYWQCRNPNQMSLWKDIACCCRGMFRMLFTVRIMC